MKQSLKLFLFLLITMSLLLANCTPASSPTMESTSPPPVTETPAPTSTVAPTQPPPTEAPPTATSQPTSTPTEVPPTEIPSPSPTPPIVSMENWSSHASTGSELSFENPGDWVGPAALPFGEGVYVKHAEQDIGVIMQYKLAGDTQQLLKKWATDGVNIPGLLVFTPDSASEAEPVTISRLTNPSQLAKGGGLVAQAVYLKRPKDVMMVMWYAPEEKWEVLQEAFTRILSSIEVWQKHTAPNGLHTMYLHDWSNPEAIPEEQGTWYHSKDEKSGLAITVRDIADPQQLLKDWVAEDLAWIEEVECTVEAGEQVSTLSGEWDTKTGKCQVASDLTVSYVVTFVANRDRVLNIFYYAPEEDWEYSDRIFQVMLSLLTDIR